MQLEAKQSPFPVELPPGVGRVRSPAAAEVVAGARRGSRTDPEGGEWRGAGGTVSSNAVPFEQQSKRSSQYQRINGY